MPKVASPTPKAWWKTGTILAKWRTSPLPGPSRGLLSRRLSRGGGNVSFLRKQEPRKKQLDSRFRGNDIPGGLLGRANVWSAPLRAEGLQSGQATLSRRGRGEMVLLRSVERFRNPFFYRKREHSANMFWTVIVPSVVGPSDGLPDIPASP